MCALQYGQPVVAHFADMLALYDRLASRGGPARTEADIQSDIKLLLLSGALDLDDADLLEVHLEEQVGDRHRIDVAIGYTVLETKKDLRAGGVLTDAIGQLGGYVARRAHESAQQYIGVLTDGHDWRLYELGQDDTLVEVATFELRSSDDGPALLDWLSAVLATTQHVLADAREVDARFGARSPAHQLAVKALRELWDAHTDDSELALKKQLWAELLHTAFGEAFTDDLDLFVEHTYLVITAELIAHEVLEIDVSALDPIHVVTGRLFAQRDVRGVVEPDFFDWPADVPGGDKVIRAMARRVAQLDWTDTSLDLLKHLYESVIAPEQRHGLGEYYTEDWLAEAVVEHVVDDPEQQRVLDPACGSGTFVFHAVRRALAALDAAGVPNKDALDWVTAHVTGMDVHPVAVTLARVTYLLAIGTKKLADRGPLAIPIYLGDSVQWQTGHSIINDDGLTVATDESVGALAPELFFPAAALADPVRFDKLVDSLTDKATSRVRGGPVPDVKVLLAPYGFSEKDRAAVTATFHDLCRLYDNHRDHIWGYYVRNLARPMWLATDDGRVDRIVGNPPWLSYRFMDAKTKKAFKERSETRNLWVGGRLATQQDLSTFFLVRCCELYLRGGGKFGMVLPLAVLSRRQAEGFRKGLWGAAGSANFEDSWDLDGIGPDLFPVPACVVTGTYRSIDQAQGTAELIGATEKWTGRVPRHTKWAAAKAKIKRSAVAPTTTPSTPGSPYKTEVLEGATITPRVLHFVERVPAAGGLGLPTGQVYVRSTRSRLEKAPWKKLPSRGPVPVEGAFVHPLHVGASLAPYRMLEPAHVVLPIDPVDGKLLDSGIPAFDAYPKTREWWAEGVRLWNQHRRGTMTLLERIDFQRTLQAQFPAGPTRLVYTKSGSRLAAAIVKDPATVIDHTLYWRAVATIDEARYLEAVLNAAVTQRLVEPLQSRGLLGPRHFDTYPWDLPIPRFDTGTELHAELAELGERAEAVAADVELPAGIGFQAARGKIREALADDGVAQEIEAAVAKLLGVKAS